jgi:chromosome segregation ATPase
MSTDAVECALREKVAALETDKRTLEAHVEMLRMHNAALDARAEHVADLRAHAGVQQQHGDALKAQYDSAMHELRLQHERAVAALERQTELLQQLLQSKDRQTALLERQLEEKDEQHRRVVATLTQQTELLQQLSQSKDRQLAEKDEQHRGTVATLSQQTEVLQHLVLSKNRHVAAEELAAAKQPAEPAADTSVTGRVVTTANFKLERRVRRGPDWKWDDQDGGAGRLGTLSAHSIWPGWCKVQWDGGVESKYRIGAQGAHDLVYAD